MIYIKSDNKIHKVINNLKNNVKQLKVFDRNILLFIKIFHLKLKNSNQLKKFPDLVALNFLLRKNNIEKIINNYDTKDRVGLGLVFHITPSNMPTNFFYSYLFGILTGNVNVVIIPNKSFHQVKILLEILENILKDKKFKKIKEMSYFVRYNKNTKITEELSSICDARVIWGGDNSIDQIRKITIPPKCREITFSDKFSCSILNLDKITQLTKNELNNVCRHFYSDGYFIDQNACSSPHLILWIGKSNYKTKKSFWSCINNIVMSKYDLPEIAIIDKFTQECEDAISLNIKNKKYYYNNKLIIKELTKIPHNLTSFRGKWGYFYEYKIRNLNDLKKIVSDKFQTITYFGVDRKKIINTIVKNHIKGIDRIVPVGSAHLMDTKWDGHDLIYSLSRIIN